MSSPAMVPIESSIGIVEVGPASHADIDAALEILNEAARWLASRGINQWPAGGFPYDTIARDVSGGELYIAKRLDLAVGTFTLQRTDEVFWPGACDDAGYVHRIAVRRAARGLGAALLKFAETFAAGAGRKFLRLDCFPGNLALRSYYERAGFVARDDLEIDPGADPTVPPSIGRFTVRRYEKSLR
jgi:GNAT superfamily N-acetyltransferase